MKSVIKILRLDHWIKNLFIAPGIVLALYEGFRPAMQGDIVGSYLHIALGILAVCVLSSANYVLNELLDAETDKFHPVKCKRPIPSGEVSALRAWYVYWSVLSLGLYLASWVNWPFFWVSVLFAWSAVWYNAKPARLKDRAYADVLCESFNKPLRLLIGWYLIAPATSFPSVLALVCYWALGAWMMALKRKSEYHDFVYNDELPLMEKYRLSFKGYKSELRLELFESWLHSTFLGFTCVFLYGLGVQMLWVLIPLVVTLDYYDSLSTKPNSCVQHPEKLWREPVLVLLILATCAAGLGLLFL